MGRPTSRGAGSLPHPLPMWVECCLSICPYFSPRCFSPSPSTSSAMRRYRSRSAPTTCPAPSWGDTDVRKSSQIRPPAGESRCDSLPRAKRLRTSPDAYLGGTEEHWGTLFGVSVIHTLREPLERLVGDRPQLRLSPLFQGLEPYPDGWRASVRKPDTLPHCPMVLHRGRCPDGSQLNLGRVRRRPGGRPAHQSDVRVRWSAHRRPTAPHQSCRWTRRRR